MLKERFAQLMHNSFMDLAKKAITDVESLPFSQDKEKINKRDPLSKVKSNFVFLTETISPILSDYCHFTKDSEEDLKVSFNMEICRSPRAENYKILTYDGVNLFLKTPEEDKADKPGIKIEEKESLALMCNIGEGAKEVLIAFGNMPKNLIAYKVKYVLEALLLQKAVKKPAHDSSEHAQVFKRFKDGVRDGVLRFHGTSEMTHSQN